MYSGRAIEIDVDGVIADIHCGLNSYVKKEFGVEFNGDLNITTWGMKELNPDLRKYILGLFNTPEFIANLKCLNGALDGLIGIDELAKKYGLKLVINTNVNLNCIDARKEWLDILLKEINVSAETIIDSRLNKNMLTDSYILVEDNVDNLNSSNAKYKFLIRRGHNRAFNRSTLVSVNKNSEVYVVDSLLDVLGILERDVFVESLVNIG